MDNEMNIVELLYTIINGNMKKVHSILLYVTASAEEE